MNDNKTHRYRFPAFALDLAKDNRAVVDRLPLRTVLLWNKTDELEERPLASEDRRKIVTSSSAYSTYESRIGLRWFPKNAVIKYNRDARYIIIIIIIINYIHKHEEISRMYIMHTTYPINLVAFFQRFPVFTKTFVRVGCFRLNPHALHFIQVFHS